MVAYKLALPDYMQMHDVFRVSLLKPTYRDRRVQPPPPPKMVDMEEWYTMDALLNHRDTRVLVKQATKRMPAQYWYEREYLVKWTGYKDEHNSWEPEISVYRLNVFKAYLAFRGLSPAS